MAEQSKSKQFVSIELEDWMWEVAETESGLLGNGINRYLSKMLQILFRVERRVRRWTR